MNHGIEMRDIEFRFEEYIRINKDFLDILCQMKYLVSEYIYI